MRAPRRYRLALRAYPADYRNGRGRELLATLAEGDDDRGGPSGREAAALAYHGLLERGRIAASGEGLLVIAAGLVLFTMFFGLTWAERQFTFGDGVRVLGDAGPSTWSGAALLIVAFTVLAAGPFRAADSARRRRRAAVVAFFVALVVWSSPGSAFKHSIPDPGVLWQVWWWSLENIHFQARASLPFAAATSVGTWLALRAVANLSAAARRRALAAGLLAAAAVVLISVWTGPNPHADFEPVSFDVGAAVFVTGLSMLLAVAAYVGSGSRSRPSASRRPSSD